MALRVGLGTDMHRLQPGTLLRIGGITVPCHYAAVAVSDGDVLLHAVTDALLGALALGDLGELYPESKVRPGEDSRRFVIETMARLAACGAKVVNADCVIDLEQPRLSPWKEAIRTSLSELLALPPERIGIKAKTREGLDAVGTGQAIAAQAVVLLEVRDD